MNTIGSTSESSTYHAVEIRAENDGAPGARIAWIGDVPNFQNNNHRRLERSLNSQQGSQRFTIAAGYELPFGRGKAVGGTASGAMNALIGGWQINWLSQFQSGIPLAILTQANNTNSYGGGSRPNSTGESSALSGPVVDRLGRCFNTSVFTQPDPYTFGNVGRTLPDVRGPAFINFDLSVLKNVSITEHLKAQLRGEAFNAFNNTNFGLPGTTLGAPGFGQITTAGPARIIQIGLKLNF